MEYQTLTYTLEDGVAVVTMNRPDRMNALNTQMRAELAFAINEAAKVARVIVLTGEGKAFCSGQDLGDGVRATNLDLERTLRDEYEPILRAIATAPVPTISAVNGPAAGAGANIALAADVVIAAESAYFMQAFAKIGLMPDAGGTYVLPRTMGTAKAMGAALFAEKITAKQADDWGMIWEHVPDAEFDTHWRERAAHLANGPTVAYAAIKKTIRDSWNKTYDDQLNEEARNQAACGKSRDFIEGVMAFTEKRDAKFEGR